MRRDRDIVGRDRDIVEIQGPTDTYVYGTSYDMIYIRVHAYLKNVLMLLHMLHIQ